jgi:hypothetical protein
MYKRRSASLFLIKIKTSTYNLTLLSQNVRFWHRGEAQPLASVRLLVATFFWRQDWGNNVIRLRSTNLHIFLHLLFLHRCVFNTNWPQVVLPPYCIICSAGCLRDSFSKTRILNRHGHQLRVYLYLNHTFLISLSSISYASNSVSHSWSIGGLTLTTNYCCWPSD